jgi:hypothetical protein
LVIVGQPDTGRQSAHSCTDNDGVIFVLLIHSGIIFASQAAPRAQNQMVIDNLMGCRYVLRFLRRSRAVVKPGALIHHHPQPQLSTQQTIAA